MKTLNIDLLNTGLIFLSFLLAYWLPFELFLFAYAVLGPLHYFTEINWIRDKSYFVANNKVWIGITLIFALLISLPLLLQLPIFKDIQDNFIVEKFIYVLPIYFNSLFFVAIICAFTFVVIKKRLFQGIAIGIGILLAVYLHRYSLYHVIIGVLLPTVIHVYLFTLLFMWYGNLKSKNKIGYFNIILLVLVPFVIMYMAFPQLGREVGKNVQNIYAENSFYILNAKISELLGITDGSSFSFYSLIDVKIQIFIAFAYTYHYLNWFSKTTIIGWHKKLTQKRSVFIILLWAASVALYFYNYRIGLTLLLFLSLLHVFMEFPLNVLSIKGIGQSIFKSKKA
ncbi:hypothetical protein [Kordia sp.]|uniref:hypothetical protein n=1 Tax=Kordia sp. TaxID=1965332 RepID=UPI003B5ADD97